LGGKTKAPPPAPTGRGAEKPLGCLPSKEDWFLMTLTTPTIKSSSKSVSRRVPLDIDFATQKIGKGAFARTCSIVYSQLKYWWRYAKHQYDGKYWFYKSQRELAEELGMSEKTIWRAIKRLRELDLVMVQKHHQHYWKQVYFYHLCFIPSPSNGDGASAPSPNPIPNKARSKQSSSHPPSSQNDCIKNTRRNPLEEIIKRANQKRPNPEQGKGFSVAPNNSCKKCRGSGLVDNAKKCCH